MATRSMSAASPKVNGCCAPNVSSTTRASSRTGCVVGRSTSSSLPGMSGRSCRRRASPAPAVRTSSTWAPPRATSSAAAPAWTWRCSEPWIDQARARVSTIPTCATAASGWDCVSRTPTTAMARWHSSVSRSTRWTRGVPGTSPRTCRRPGPACTTPAKRLPRSGSTIAVPCSPKAGREDWWVGLRTV